MVFYKDCPNYVTIALILKVSFKDLFIAQNQMANDFLNFVIIRKINITKCHFREKACLL